MSLSEKKGTNTSKKPVTVKGVVFVTHNHSSRRRELDDMAAGPQALHSETAPDAWASKMLLLHSDRRHRHCHVNRRVDRFCHEP